MTVTKLIVGLTAAIFVAYGLAFALFPEYLSQVTTHSTPVSEAGLIDMRATYGGMSIAIGMLLFVLYRSELRLGLIGVLLLMLGMAVTRTYGILIDGSANKLMYVYLALEIGAALVAAVLLSQRAHEYTHS